MKRIKMCVIQTEDIPLDEAKEILKALKKTLRGLVGPLGKPAKIYISKYAN